MPGDDEIPPEIEIWRRRFEVRFARRPLLRWACRWVLTGIEALWDDEQGTDALVIQALNRRLMTPLREAVEAADDEAEPKVWGQVDSWSRLAAELPRPAPPQE